MNLFKVMVKKHFDVIGIVKNIVEDRDGFDDTDLFKKLSLVSFEDYFKLI